MQISRTEVQQYTGLMVHFARKFQKPGHAMMETDDLIQEGWLVFHRCKSRYADKPKEDFDRLLKKSLNNHMVSLSVYHQQPHRSAPMVDLEDGVENFGYEQTEQVLFNDTLEQMANRLDPTSLSVMEQLLSPSEEVLKVARVDQMRKRHIQAQGVSIRGFDTLRILDKHIAEVLGLSRREMSFHRDEIRIAGILQGINC